MPNVGVGLPEEMAEDPGVFSQAGRKRWAVDPLGLDQNGPVPPKVSRDVADEVLAAVVPWRRNRFGHEKNVSHLEASYAGLASRARP